MTVGLHYTVDGAAGSPLLVLGASLGTTGAIWQPQVEALSARYQVIRYDHRGHGGSPAPPGPYRLDDLGGDVLALLDTLGAHRVRLGGVSLGGMLAIWVAAHAPDRIEQLAVLCASPRFGQPEVWAERAATVRAQGTTAIADGALQRWFPPDFVARHPGVAGWARRQLTTTPAGAYADCCAALETADVTPLLGQVTAPTLVVAGADDPVSPPEHADRLAAGIPSARVEVVADASHLAHVAQPATVSRLLLDFFEEGGHD